MKEKLRILGIIAIIAVVGLAFVACDDGADCDHVWGEWIEDKAATLSAEGERHRICEECDETEYEDIPKWEALFGTTWNNTNTGAGQHLRITANKFEINVTKPATNPSGDIFNFTIDSWEYSDSTVSGHGLTGDVIAFKLKGSLERAGAFTAGTAEFDIFVTLDEGSLRIYWSSTGNTWHGSPIIFVPIADWL